jgi:hypothetical protein
MILTYAIVLALVVACALALVIERRRSRDAEADARLAVERATRRQEAHRAALRHVREAARARHKSATVAGPVSPAKDSSYSSMPSNS